MMLGTMSQSVNDGFQKSVIRQKCLTLPLKKLFPFDVCVTVRHQYNDVYTAFGTM